MCTDLPSYTFSHKHTLIHTQTYATKSSLTNTVASKIVGMMPDTTAKTKDRICAYRKTTIIDHWGGRFHLRLKNNNNCVITTVVLYRQITRCKINITTEHLLSKEGRGFTLFVFQGIKQNRKNMYRMKRFCPETVNRIVECSYNSESTHALWTGECYKRLIQSNSSKINPRE